MVKAAKTIAASGAILLLAGVVSTSAWQPASPLTGRRNTELRTYPSARETIEKGDTNRRSFCLGLLATGAAATATSLVVAPQRASAVLARSEDRFDFSQALTEELAKQRFKEGQKSLKYLLDNFDNITEGGGDNVRRYLGTVGTTSGLWGIGKVLTALRDSADDIVEFTELKNELESAIQSADGSSYMAIFVTTSSSSTPPQKYFEDARKEIRLAQRLMDQLAKEIQQS